MRGHPIHYSAEELAWLEENHSLPIGDYFARFSAQFGRADVSAKNLKSLRSRMGWKTGRTGCFAKGHVPANKGEKMPYNENSARTRFKKGNRTGRANLNYKPIGSERLSKEGYVERKIHDGMPFQSRWRAVHRIRWEEVNGPVPAGHFLKCLDSDRTNTDPANWECLPRAMLVRLAGGNRHRRLLAYDDAPAELKPVVMATAKLEDAARRSRKGRPT